MDNLYFSKTITNPENTELLSTGEGLSNIAQQYQLLFSKKIDINKGQDTFKVSLPVMKEYNSPSNNQLKIKKNENKFKS